MTQPRQAVLDSLRQALVSGETDGAIALLVDVLMQQGYLQASALFSEAQGIEIAPDVWLAAIAQIRDTPEGQVIENVLRSSHHCHLMGVYPEPENPGPPFTYSIGLWYNFQHPEILCIGLPHQTAAVLINTYAEQIAEGNPPPLDTPLGETLTNNYYLQFKHCQTEAKTDYTCWASWFNGTVDYPVVQLVWQDKQYRWPWETEFHPAAAQPMLFTHAV